MSGVVFFNVLYIGYFVAVLFFAFTVFSRGAFTRRLGQVILGLVLAWHTAAIAQRWVLAGRPPMSNMFETLVLFGWTVVLVYLILDFRYGLRALGAPASLTALLSLGFATLVFPDTIEPLMPALQNSFWLTTHVSFCFVGYGALTIGYLLCLMHLMRRDDWHRYAACFVSALTLVAIVAGVVGVRLQRSGAVDLSLTLPTAAAFVLGSLIAAGALTPAVSGLVRLLKLDSELGEGGALEKGLYQAIVLGFVFLSVGIVTGSVWAQQAWGRYWGWDPKETWSFITWLIYGIYLHVRFGWRRKGVLTVWLAILGFWAVIFTYFGVNYLLSSLHSYV
jgi:cytochrome c-type biogenesis protein CcsB